MLLPVAAHQMHYYLYSLLGMNDERTKCFACVTILIVFNDRGHQKMFGDVVRYYQMAIKELLPI
jgi:hypothetical protein